MTLEDVSTALALDGGGIEGAAVHSAIDDADSVLRPASRSARARAPSGVAGIGNDAVASRHDAVIGGLQWTRFAIGAVIGGDEGLARPPAARNALQAGARLRACTRSTPRSSIRLARRRILARMVNGDLLATGSVTISPPALRHLLGHVAPFGGDQRASARRGTSACAISMVAISLPPVSRRGTT